MQWVFTLTSVNTLPCKPIPQDSRPTFFITCTYARTGANTHTHPTTHAYTRSSPQCSNCSSGKYALVAFPQCRDCPRGRFSLRRSSTCTNCAEGLYADEAGSPSCGACPTGWYSTPGNGICTICQEGLYADETGSPGCAECPVGWYSLPGNSTCTSCPVGWYVPGTRNDECLSCPAGYKRGERGEGSCGACAHGRYTGVVGRHGIRTKNIAARSRVHKIFVRTRAYRITPTSLNPFFKIK